MQTNSWIPYDGLPERYIFDYKRILFEQFASPLTVKFEDKYLKKVAQINGYMDCPWKAITLKSIKNN